MSRNKSENVHEIQKIPGDTIFFRKYSNFRNTSKIFEEIQKISGNTKKFRKYKNLRKSNISNESYKTLAVKFLVPHKILLASLRVLRVILIESTSGRYFVLPKQLFRRCHELKHCQRHNGPRVLSL